MSLPSLANVTGGNAEDLLLSAIRDDLPLAWKWFSEAKTGTHLSEPPHSPLGKQIVRICAADGLRRLVEKHLLNGNRIVFANCCDVMVLSPAKYADFDALQFQIDTQNGRLNHADC